MTDHHQTIAPERAVDLTQPTMEIVIGIKQLAHDQIFRSIEERFPRHALADLVAAVLKAGDFKTKVAKPGPDGGVDIWASRGEHGFDPPYICVQVKSSKNQEPIETLRALKGVMATHKATQGLLVAWSGFTRPLVRAAAQCYFDVQLWDGHDLVKEVLRVYDRLPEDMHQKLPLERVWLLRS